MILWMTSNGNNFLNELLPTSKTLIVKFDVFAHMIDRSPIVWLKFACFNKSSVEK